MKPVKYWLETSARGRRRLRTINDLETRIKRFIAIGAVRYLLNLIEPDQANDIRKLLFETEINIEQNIDYVNPFYSIKLAKGALTETITCAIRQIRPHQTLENAIYAETNHLFQGPELSRPQRMRDYAYQEIMASAIAFQNNMFLPMFFPVKWDINWRTSDTMGIAKTMYATGDYSSCGFLRDALMDAGCEEPDIMEILSCTNLCRGCWILEQLQ